MNAILYDWSHEGPDDPAADEALANKAWTEWQEHRDRPRSQMSLKEFCGELARAEAEGELPD